MEYQKKIHFYNNHTKRNDSLILSWKFEEGFQDMEYARLAILAAGQDPELFLYVKFHGNLYAVAANLMEQAIIVSKDYVWYREPSTERIHREDRNSYLRLPYTITEVNPFQYYRLTMCQDLNSFDMNMSIIMGQRLRNVSSAYKDFCVATLGAVMVTTMIPSYQLGAMEQYFQDISSFSRIWQFGIKSYNPFNGYREIATYSLEEYMKESRLTQENMEDYAYIRNELMGMNVMDDDVDPNEQLMIPFHYGKKLVFALNMLLGEVPELMEEEPLETMIEEEPIMESETHIEENNMLFGENKDKRMLKFCRICHVSLPTNTADNICPVCREQELFVEVKDYIRERDVTEREVAEHFHIPLNKVRGWIKEGRITYKETPGIKAETFGPTKKCRECGMQLPSSSKDNICQTCLGILSATKSNMKSSGVMIENPNDNSSKRYYH